MNQDTGKYIVIVGAAIVVIGILIYFFHDKLNWFGRLPGDIRIERDNFRFYFPVTTMILLSVVISAILWVIRKFL
jgi:H+/Cl- antiporter ClcA